MVRPAASRCSSGASWSGARSLLFPVAVAGLGASPCRSIRRKVVLHRFTCFVGVALHLAQSRSGRVHDPRPRTPRRRACASVLVANHLSLLDILVLFRLFRHFKWVSKIENFRVPFIGWNMTLQPLRAAPARQPRKRSADAASTASARSAEGSSIMVFPGRNAVAHRTRCAASSPAPSRSRLRTKRPIVPIALLGTADALPKRGFVLQGRHEIEVNVLEPMPVRRRFADTLSVDELTEQRARARIAAALEERDEGAPGERAR